MVCERCNKKKATVFYRENISGRVRALRLCADCTEILEAAGELEDISAAIAGFTSPFFRIEETGIALPLRVSESNTARTGTAVSGKCPLCGVSAGEIASTGRVGCARCYEVFDDLLGGAIRAMHGKVVHTGRVSAGFRERQERVERLSRLKRRLKEAVAAEQFETAVGLRDEIRGLEADMA